MSVFQRNWDVNDKCKHVVKYDTVINMHANGASL